MKNRSRQFIGLLIIGVLFGGYLFFNGNPLKVRQIEEDTVNYLVQKGFKESDLIEVQGRYDWLKVGYLARVKFKDEPLEIYRYTYDINGNMYLWTSTNFGEHPKEKE